MFQIHWPIKEFKRPEEKDNSKTPPRSPILHRVTFRNNTPNKGHPLPTKKARSKNGPHRDPQRRCRGTRKKQNGAIRTNTRPFHIIRGRGRFVSPEQPEQGNKGRLKTRKLKGHNNPPRSQCKCRCRSQTSQSTKDNHGKKKRYFSAGDPKPKPMV